MGAVPAKLKTGPLSASGVIQYWCFLFGILTVQCRHLVAKLRSRSCFFFPSLFCSGRHKHIADTLTQMASLALFPSIASVFTLKSTPNQSDRGEKKKVDKLKTVKCWVRDPMSVHRSLLSYVFTVCLCWRPIVADSSGSKVSSVNLSRRLLDKVKIKYFIYSR